LNQLIALAAPLSVTWMTIFRIDEGGRFAFVKFDGEAGRNRIEGTLKLSRAKAEGAAANRDAKAAAARAAIRRNVIFRPSDPSLFLSREEEGG
jgi:hypothetical protein